MTDDTTLRFIGHDLPGQTADKLIEWAVHCAHPPRGKGPQPLYVAVMHVFGLGSTYAHALCRRYECDPDEMRKPQ